MKSLIRVLALWLLLVALPFQGFASASMLLCGAAAPAVPAMAAGHDHAAMLAAAHHADDHASAHQDGADSHCGGMSDCCVGAALAYALPQVAARPQPVSRLRVTEPAPPAPVDLALPKRPPRSSFA